MGFYCSERECFIALWGEMFYISVGVITKWEIKHHFHVLKMIKCHRMLDMHTNAQLFNTAAER